MKDIYKSTRLACYASYTVQAIAVNIAPLFFAIFNDKYNLSLTELGSLVLFTFFIQLTIDIAAIKIIEKLGYRYTSIAANLAAALGLLLLAFLPQIMTPLPSLIIAAFFYSLGAGLIEVVINPIAEALPNDNLGASLTILHSFYGWGQAAVVLISTIILRFITNDLWFVIPVLWSIIPFINAFLFTKVPIVENKGEQKKHSFDILKNPVFILFLIVMICGGSTEMVIAQWASYFAEKGLGVSKIAGDLLGPCIFGLMMAAGRTIYGFFGKRIVVSKALAICSVLAVLSYLGIGLFKNPIIVMLFFALSGIATSLLWPGTLAASSYTFKNGGTTMFALLAFAGDVGCSLGPWLNGVLNDKIFSNSSFQFLTKLGFLPEQAALRQSIIVTAIFPLIILITFVFISKQSKNK